MVKTLPTVQELWVLGQEDPLEEEMATQSSILAWEIPQREEPDGLQSLRLKESDTTEQLNTTYIRIYKQYAYILEKAMATHSSTLAWKIPWTEEPGRLQSMGSLGVGHN